MKFLLEPEFFNWLLIGLFAAAAIRWAFERNWPQVAYFVGAVILNVAVTYMAAK